MASAGIRTSFHDSGSRPRTPLQTPWRNFNSKFSRHGSAAGGAGELSGAAGMGANWRHTGDIFARRTGERIFAGAGHAFASSLRYGEAVLAEPALFKSPLGQVSLR